MNKLLNEIIQYLNNAHIDDDINLRKILPFYVDIDEIYQSHNEELKYIKPLTQSQKTFFDSIYKHEVSNFGGFVYLKSENILVENVRSLDLKRIYPTIIKLMYQNGKLTKDFESFSFLVENFDIIYNNLSNTAQKIFRSMINFKYASLSYSLICEVTLFARTIFENILKNDFLEDIVYIDTDEIIIYNDENTINYFIKYLDDIFNITISEDRTYYFIAKKKYIILNDSNFVKGIQENKKFKNKQQTNNIYRLYKENLSNNLEFKNFIKSDYYIKYKELYLKMEKRMKKFNRIKEKMEQ